MTTTTNYKCEAKLSSEFSGDGDKKYYLDLKVASPGTKFLLRFEPENLIRRDHKVQANVLLDESDNGSEYYEESHFIGNNVLDRDYTEFEVEFVSGGSGATSQTVHVATPIEVPRPGN